LAELSPLNSELFQALPGLSAKEVQRVISSTSEEEYEFIRLLARSLLLWMPMLLPLMRLSLGAKGVAMVDAAQSLFHDPPAGVHEALIIGMLLSLRVKGSDQAQIRELMQGLTADSIDTEMRSLIATETRPGARAGGLGG
jgi:hypothetical protein